MRQHGEWEAWIDFFLEGVENTVSGARAPACAWATRPFAGGRRNRLFSYDAYLAILSEGTEPL